MKAIYTIADLFDSEVYQSKYKLQEISRRYFSVAGITVCLESTLDFDAINFSEELMVFAVNSPGEDNIILRHHFEMPDLTDLNLGEELYRTTPWAISMKDGIWCYKGILHEQEKDEPYHLALFNSDYSLGVIYNHSKEKVRIRKTKWQSLSLMPTDQIWLASLMANRYAVLMHSSAAIVNGNGIVFIGHSDAGKTTTMELLKDAQHKFGLEVVILCDDRNLIRRWPDCWRVHGTWSHGDIAEVSSAGAPLVGIFFLEQSENNSVSLLADHKIIWRHLLATLIRPMVTAKWWQQEIDILEQLIKEVPCYKMQFDKSGKIIPELAGLIN